MKIDPAEFLFILLLNQSFLRIRSVGSEGPRRHLEVTNYRKVSLPLCTDQLFLIIQERAQLDHPVQFSADVDNHNAQAYELVKLVIASIVVKKY